MSEELTAQAPPPCSDPERLRRWRLILGGKSADVMGMSLAGRDVDIDRVLTALYDPESEEGLARRRGGTGQSSPSVARWLGDIRRYFPTTVVRILQKDALERLNLKRMLLEPELLDHLEPDVHLVAQLLTLSSVIPPKTRDTARRVVRRVVEDLMRRLDQPMRQAITGSLNRTVRNHRPRHSEVDWLRTINANLKHYQPEYKTVIPQQLIGFGRKQRRIQRDIILCVDQSGSMAATVIYSSIFAAVMASLPVVRTRMIVFDTAVADLTADLHDPVDLLFGAQLGGGTDINRALAYCQGLVTHPQNTILVLITDLYEGGKAEEMLKRASALLQSGVQLVTLLALSDAGSPAYNAVLAGQLAALGSPVFACTPDLFPRLMAAAMQRRDISQWASEQNIPSIRQSRL